MFKVLNLNVFIIGERNPDGSYKIQNPTNVKYRELLVNLDDSNTPISVPPILLCESFLDKRIDNIDYYSLFDTLKMALTIITVLEFYYGCWFTYTFWC